MIKIKHIRQKNDGFTWKCGAVCLEMVLKYFDIECDQDEIWEAIKTNRQTGIGQYYAKTYKLAQYSLQKGLTPTIYKSDSENCLQTLDSLDMYHMPAILSVQEKKSSQSHFIVYVGKKDGKYCFSDPNSEKELVKYGYAQVREMWRENWKIDVSGFVYIVFGKSEQFTVNKCGNCSAEYPVLTKEGGWLSPVTICPYCDSGNLQS